VRFLAIFLAFSGNSRNLLLGKSNDITFGQIARFRGLFVIPFGLAVYILCKSTSVVPDLLIFILIIRRSTEWLAELVVTDREMAKDNSFAQWYVLLQAVSFSLLLSKGFIREDAYNFLFFFWAISPVLIGGGYLFQAFRVSVREKILPVRGYILHLGSSWVIASSTFVFRIMVLAFTNKSIGGELFTAFAIGGMLSSVYTYVIGPSLISKETQRIKKLFQIIVFSCVGVGIGIVCVANIFSVSFIGNGFFIQAIGFSVIGGAFMMASQRQRIILLQVKNKSVFVPDLIASILIVAIIPLLFYTIGIAAFSALFLCNALLTWMLYSFPIKGRNAIEF